MKWRTVLFIKQEQASQMPLNTWIHQQKYNITPKLSEIALNPKFLRYESDVSEQAILIIFIFLKTINDLFAFVVF